MVYLESFSCMVEIFLDSKFHSQLLCHEELKVLCSFHNLAVVSCLLTLMQGELVTLPKEVVFHSRDGFFFGHQLVIDSVKCLNVIF